MNLKQVKKELLKDPAFKKEWEKKNIEDDFDDVRIKYGLDKDKFIKAFNKYIKNN